MKNLKSRQIHIIFSIFFFLHVSFNAFAGDVLNTIEVPEQKSTHGVGTMVFSWIF